MDDQQLGFPLEFLSLFNSLTHLEIHNQCMEYATKNISLQSIFIACPNRTNFKLDTKYLNVKKLDNTSGQHLGERSKVFKLCVSSIRVDHLLNFVTVPGLDEFRLHASGDVFCLGSRL